jgi:hypothetical protein
MRSSGTRVSPRANEKTSAAYHSTGVCQGFRAGLHLSYSLWGCTQGNRDTGKGPVETVLLHLGNARQEG